MTYLLGLWGTWRDLIVQGGNCIYWAESGRLTTNQCPSSPRVSASCSVGRKDLQSCLSHTVDVRMRGHLGTRARPAKGFPGRQFGHGPRGLSLYFSISLSSTNPENVTFPHEANPTSQNDSKLGTVNFDCCRSSFFLRNWICKFRKLLDNFFFSPSCGKIHTAWSLSF